jgi:hypothetical protein
VTALTEALAGAGAFDAAWDAFADGWADRWSDAFTPKPASGGGRDAAGAHFSGSLPVLELDESPAGDAIEFRTLGL